MVRPACALVLLALLPLSLAPSRAHAIVAPPHHDRADGCQRVVARATRRHLERRARRRRTRDKPIKPPDELVARVRAALRDAADLRDHGLTRFRQLSLDLEDAELRWLDDPATVTIAELRDLERRVIRAGNSRIAAFGVDEYADRRADRLNLLRDLRDHNLDLLNRTKNSQIANEALHAPSSFTRRANRQHAPDSAHSTAMSAAQREANAAEAELIGRNIRAAIAQAPPPLNTNRGVARKIGVDETLFSRWANGHVRPGPDHQRELEQTLERPRGWFMGEHPELEDQGE